MSIVIHKAAQMQHSLLLIAREYTKNLLIHFMNDLLDVLNAFLQES